MTAIRESAELLKLKADKLIEIKENGLLLKEDIWEKGTLVLKSGVYLTEELINKLLRFGIKRVNVDLENFSEKNALSEFPESMTKKYIASQSALIVEKNIIDAGLMIKYLIDIGFKGGNIFITKEPNFINRYFGAKKINFLFIDGGLYPKCARCVQKYTSLRNLHAFVLLNSADFNEFKKMSKFSKINFLFRPVKENSFKRLVSHALDQNFLDFWTEEDIMIS